MFGPAKPFQHSAMLVGKSILDWSTLKVLHFGMLSGLPGTNTAAYNKQLLITAVKSLKRWAQVSSIL
jgi:hypothetical protein